MVLVAPQALAPAVTMWRRVQPQMTASLLLVPRLHHDGGTHPSPGAADTLLYASTDRGVILVRLPGSSSHTRPCPLVEVAVLSFPMLGTPGTGSASLACS